ncbi:MAG: TetR/AcrR family transcriptional regulator [Rickettsiales bacterium]|nr:TetR/AcrR family transcriptional regulator [Rickettsiales bacterium]
MARRNDHTRQEIMEMAVQAGKSILDKEGTAGFSARKIARQIGYTIGTLYNVFDNYANLALHINAVTLDAMAEYITVQVSDYKTKNCNIYIKKLADAHIEFVRTNYNSWSALFEFNLFQDTSLPKWYTDKIERLFEFIEDPLQYILKDNEKNIKDSARILWASIHGICQLGTTNKLTIVGEGSSVQPLVHSLIDTYILGLQSKKYTDHA